MDSTQIIELGVGATIIAGGAFLLAYIKKLISLKTSHTWFIQLLYKMFFQFKLYFYRIINRSYLKKLLKKYLNYQNLLIINGGYPAAESCRTAAIVGKKLGFKNILFTVLSTPQDYSKIKVIQFLEKRQDKKFLTLSIILSGTVN